MKSPVPVRSFVIPLLAGCLLTLVSVRAHDEHPSPADSPAGAGGPETAQIPAPDPAANLHGFVRNLPPGDEYVRLLGKPESLALHAGLVTLAPGEDCGWHSTEHYEEMIICLEGKGQLASEDFDERLALQAGQYGYNPPHTRHCVFNTGEKKMRYIYIVAPALPEEDAD